MVGASTSISFYDTNPNDAVGRHERAERGAQILAAVR